MDGDEGGCCLLWLLGSPPPTWSESNGVHRIVDSMAPMVIIINIATAAASTSICYKWLLDSDYWMIRRSVADDGRQMMSRRMERGADLHPLLECGALALLSLSRVFPEK